jgi:hypothetical protein
MLITLAELQYKPTKEVFADKKSKAVYSRTSVEEVNLLISWPAENLLGTTSHQ